MQEAEKFIRYLDRVSTVKLVVKDGKGEFNSLTQVGHVSVMGSSVVSHRMCLTSVFCAFASKEEVTCASKRGLTILR